MIKEEIIKILDDYAESGEYTGIISNDKFGVIAKRIVENCNLITKISENRLYTLEEVKMLMCWARDRGERHRSILYDEWLEQTLAKIDELKKHNSH